MPRVTRPASDPYDGLASAYDIFSGAYQHDRWLQCIEELARNHGMRGMRALDLACGTGKSFLPLLDRGYDVTACDVSQAMVEIARRKTAEAEIFVGDMRSLRVVGEFDLITCLDDAVNYLLDPRDLTLLFRSVARNLAADGVMVFDLNTIKTYEGAYTSQWHLDDPGAFIAWNGRPDPTRTPDHYQAEIVVFTSGDSGWTRTRSLHHQRHWSEPAIRAAVAEAGLRVAAVHGQRRGVRIDAALDELVHDKGLYFITHDDTEGTVNTMASIEP